MLVTLLGAGFSKNFGIPISSELSLQIAGILAQEGHADLANRLFDGANFEFLIGQASSDATGYKALRFAALRCFETIDEQLTARIKRQRETMGRFHELLSSFISCTAKQGPIFTTNQDLLIERLYDGSNNERLTRPGVTTQNSRGADWFFGMPDTPWDSFTPKFSVSRFAIDDQSKKNCYIKLHGSLDWSQGLGTNLIFGDRKVQQANDNGLLSEYLEVFKRRLTEDATKLLIVGFSFSDDHLKQIITEGASKRNLKIYVVDTAPFDVYKKNLVQSFDNNVKLDRCIVGYTQRLLTEIVQPKSRTEPPIMPPDLAGFIAAHS